MEERITTAFARSIYAKVDLLGAINFDRRDAWQVRNSIGFDIRKYSDLLVPEASDAALKLAEERRIDLRAARWKDQNRFDPGRDLFLLEHVVTVKSIQDACVAASSEAEVAKVLANVRIAWICRFEDERLTALGFRSKRPDPRAAYLAAGIALRGFTDGEVVE